MALSFPNATTRERYFIPQSGATTMRSFGRTACRGRGLRSCEFVYDKRMVKAKVKAAPKRKRSDPMDRLLKQARALGLDSFVVMPIDEIQLGFKLAARPRASVLPKLLVLADDPNMHARRIALSAFRRMNAWDDPRVLERLLRGLEDPAGWVRYDAAWALGESGTNDARVIAGLRKLARSAVPNPALGDGDARAASRDARGSSATSSRSSRSR